MISIICHHCGKSIEGEDSEEAASRLLEHILQKHPKRPELTAAVSEAGWEEKTASFFVFEDIGDSIEGKLVGFDMITLHDNQVQRCRLETVEGPKRFLLTTQLEQLILDVAPGTLIRIHYEGEVKSKAGRNVKQFKVWTKKNAP